MTALLRSFFLVFVLLLSSKMEGTGTASPTDQHVRERLEDLNPGSNWIQAVVLFGMAVLLCIGISYLFESSDLCAQDQSQSEQDPGKYTAVPVVHRDLNQPAGEKLFLSLLEQDTQNSFQDVTDRDQGRQIEPITNGSLSSASRPPRSQSQILQFKQDQQTYAKHLTCMERLLEGFLNDMRSRKQELETILEDDVAPFIPNQATDKLRFTVYEIADPEPDPERCD